MFENYIKMKSLKIFKCKTWKQKKCMQNDKNRGKKHLKDTMKFIKRNNRF